jgi:hypothetical protein
LDLLREAHISNPYGQNEFHSGLSLVFRIFLDRDIGGPFILKKFVLIAGSAQKLKDLFQGGVQAS